MQNTTNLPTATTPASRVVLGRVWRGGLVWGPVTAGWLMVMSTAWVLATMVIGGGYRDEELRQAAALCVLLLFLALLHGLAAGFATGLVGGLLLAVLRRAGGTGLGLAWLLTQVFLAGMCAVVSRMYPDVAHGLGVPVCLLAAAYPVWRTLRRALDPMEVHA